MTAKQKLARALDNLRHLMTKHPSAKVVRRIWYWNRYAKHYALRGT